ncbi:MAG: phosphate acetyltransferase [Calditrichaceae bacterium]
MAILDNFAAKCRLKPKTIIFPDASDIRVIEAVRQLIDEKLADPVLVGSPFGIREEADKAGVSTRGMKIIAPHQDEKYKEYTEKYYELRKEKGVTRYDAEEVMRNPLYFSAMYVRDGRSDICVGGNQSTTADVLRAAIQIIGVAEGIKTVSSFFLMIHPDGQQVYAFADCAVIPEPTSEQLAEIAVTTAGNYLNLTGISPKTAMLSFSTKGSATHPAVEEIQAAVEIAKRLKPDFIIDGEMQFDAALIPAVAKIKAPGSPLEAGANVFIFPSLEAGNIGYKIAQRLGGFKALGPMIQGLKHQMHDLSRGCSVQDIIDVSVTASSM